MSRRASSFENLARTAAYLSPVALLLAAGAAHPGQEEAEAPQFPTRVELGTVGVVVTDSERRPVGGLGRGDFTLTEDGVPQTLSTFEAIELPEKPTIAPMRLTTVSTNVRAEVEAAPGRWFGLVLDDLHLQFREARYAKAAATAFVETAGEGDQVTLATSSGEVWWSARMPAGRPELLALLERVGARAVPDQGPDGMSPYQAQRSWVDRDPEVKDYVERRLLGYQPSNAARDGIYRKIKIEVSGKGLDVRARKGYRASLEGEKGGAEDAASGDA